MKSLTYKDAGVDVEAGNELARRLGKMASTTHRPEMVSGIGGFAGVFSIPAGLEEPLLVSSTDGVGTKLKVAIAAKKHDTVGVDLVAMGVNDVLVVGAEPLFFLDYLSVGKLDPNLAESVITGVVEGCRQSGCTLLGGETAEMPGMYAPGEYDLAGFVVGVVEKSRVIDGASARAGDVVLGLPSSGLHSNGYSLARKVLLDPCEDPAAFHPDLGCSVWEELLKPTRIYARSVALLRGSVDVHAMAHITGGGLVDNPPRCVPEDLAFRLHTSTWTVPRVMEVIARLGNVAPEEMLRTFNMGLGMLLVVPATQADLALDLLAGHDAIVVGEIIPRAGQSVEFVKTL